MLQEIILGIVQGVAEWLPVSSEGLLILIQLKFFSQEIDLKSLVHNALFLHLGTFLAALVYLRKDVAKLLKAVFSYKEQKEETQKVLQFLIIVTLISGLWGIFLLEVGSYFENRLDFTGQAVTFFLGLLLLVTGSLQLRANTKVRKKVNEKTEKNLQPIDMLLLGIIQGFAALPGLSRSGLTVSALILRGFEKERALRLSFLMSLPIVLGGNILINLANLELTNKNLLGFLFSFLFGLFTIHLLLKLARKINFGYFVLAFGILTLLSLFL